MPAPLTAEAGRISDALAMMPVRSLGGLDLRFDRRGAVAQNHQSGCMRMRMPRGDDPTAVLINTGGGLAEGDRILQRLEWQEGAAVTVTTQACEKVYRAMHHGAEIETELAIGAHASAEWLPQETILFDAARLARSTSVSLDRNARFLGLEAVVFGRAAMQEQVLTGLLLDRWRIIREGRLIYADVLRLDGPVSALMARAALGGGARAMAVIILAVAAAGALLDAVRQALGAARGLAAASSWNDLLVVRLLAGDGATLRADIELALAALRPGRSLPRVWRC